MPKREESFRVDFELINGQSINSITRGKGLWKDTQYSRIYGHLVECSIKKVSECLFKKKRKKKKQYPVEVSTWLVGCAKIPKFDTASLLPCFLGNLI
jgi:hypothetical protein